MTHNIHNPSSIEAEMAGQYFDVRFTGALSEIESELALGSAGGNEVWCDAFRDLHDGDLGEPASAGLLGAFANAAPSLLLRSYVFGAVFARETCLQLEMPLTEWLEMANGTDDSKARGLALGCAFGALSAHIRTRRPRSGRPLID